MPQLLTPLQMDALILKALVTLVEKVTTDTVIGYRGDASEEGDIKDYCHENVDALDAMAKAHGHLKPVKKKKKVEMVFVPAEPVNKWLYLYEKNDEYPELALCLWIFSEKDEEALKHINQTAFEWALEKHTHVDNHIMSYWLAGQRPPIDLSDMVIQ